MTLSIRNLAVDLIGTRVAAIAIADGYSCDVQRVLRRPPFAADLQPNLPHPTAFLWVDRNVHLPDSPETAMGQVNHDLALYVTIVGYGDEDRADEIAGELEADIEQAVTTATGAEVGGAVLDVLPLIGETMSDLPVGIVSAGMLFRMRFATPLAQPRVAG